jgi:TolB-like protein/DNA-binding SARP family transcriptional activator/Flp pilus assembly protein TadD
MFRLRVLGGFALDGLPGAAPALSKRRAEAVLAVLAVCGDLGCSRERLLALLWPESDDAGARQGLRDALHVIRRAIGAGAVPSSGRVLRLDPAVVVSDVVQFTQALAAGRTAEAARLYAGPLLHGFHVDDAAEFESWLDGERARLAREYGEALRDLAAEAEAREAWSEAQSWWARAVEHDPLNSHLVLQQVRVLATVGDRAGAIRVAEGHARRLRDEFDLEPDREILATIERIRRGELSTSRAERPIAAVEPTPPPQQSADAPTPDAEPSPAATPQPPQRAPRWLGWVAGVALLAAGGAYAAGRLPESRAEVSASRTAIAVLPFRNLSEDTSYAYVARGLHDELLTQLAKVSSLRVIGRASVLGYEETSKSLRQIGEELAVGSIVEAGVQVDSNRLRVTVHLLDPKTQAHVWAERYDRTLDDAFAVQSDIAQRIVAAVGGRLTTAEGGAIAAPPTQVAGAYEFYLQGLTYQRRPGFLWENFRVAQQLFERAIALDPDFALAHAALATVHVTMHKLRYDLSSGRLEIARREAETALRLAPDLPQAHVAAAWVRYHLGGQYGEVVDQINLALRGAPNDPEIWGLMGVTQLSLGRWDSAVAAFEHARRLDPRDPNVHQLLGDTYHFIRRYPEAIESYRHASAFAPDLVQPRLSAGWSYFLWRGELDTLRSILRSVPPGVDPGWGGGSLEHQRLTLLLWERRPDSVLALLRGMPPAPGTNAEAVVTRALMAAEAHRLRGDSAAARSGFDAVATLLSEDRTHPDDQMARIGRGLAMASLGRRAEARREARWLERLDARRQDHHDAGPPYWAARILTRIGDTGAALDLVERLLAGPSLFSVHELRISPEFDPLRGDARYRALLERFSSPSQ